MDNVLFVTAHPDDLEINAGGTVSALLRDNKKVYCCISSMPPQTRITETKKAMKVLGIENFQFGFGTDTKLYQTLDQTVNILDSFIKNHNIDTVFTHHPGDGHQDHRTTSEATAAACRNVSTLIYFRPTAPSTNTGIAFIPNLTVILDASDIEKKKEALSCHQSQIVKYGTEDWIDRMEDIAKADAWIYSGKHGYVEVFQISRMQV